MRFKFLFVSFLCCFSLVFLVDAVRPGQVVVKNISFVSSVVSVVRVNGSLGNFSRLPEYVDTPYCRELNHNLSLLRPSRLESWGAQAGYFRALDDVRVMSGCKRTKFFAGPSVTLQDFIPNNTVSFRLVDFDYFDVSLVNRSVENLDNHTLRFWVDMGNLSGRMIGFKLENVSCRWNVSARKWLPWW
jgi:hypothetical protein